MSWGKFLVGAFAVTVIVCALCFGVYGKFYLLENIVTLNSYPRAEWVNDYILAGVFSCLNGLFWSVIWFFVGLSHNGRSAISVKYWMFFFMSLILGITIFYFVTPPARGGGDVLAAFHTIVAPSLIYWLVSLLVPPPSGKYIPPMSSFFH